MRTRLLALGVGLCLAAGACSNSPSTTGAATTTASPGTASGPGTSLSEADRDRNVPVDQPGVTDDVIRVGGVASATNPLGGQVQALISEDDVFAVVPVATLLFAGAPLTTSNGVPTFGWNINPEFAGAPNLFGEKGSYLCFTCGFPIQPWLAQQSGRTKAAVLAYSVSEQSKQCAAGVQAAFERYPTAEMVFVDTAVAYGTTDFSVQVSKMKDAGVDWVSTCMDNNAVIALAREMRKQELDVTQYMQNAYDDELLANFGDVLEGSYVMIQAAPSEVGDPPPGLADYLEWTERTGAPRNEVSLAGWLSAALFVRGLEAAGPEFTRQKVIDGLNQVTDWDADGASVTFDWTRAHTQSQVRSCYAILQIEGGAFVPRFGEPGKPYICFDPESATLEEPERTS
jgi:hypothetical protein